MLQMVLGDELLMEFYEYNPADYETLDQALDSDIPVVAAVAKLIRAVQYNRNANEVYTEVSNYLKNNLI